MKQNNTINVLFLFLCVLLLGFVYLNTRMIDSFKMNDPTESMHIVEPDASNGSPIKEIR